MVGAAPSTCLGPQLASKWCSMESFPPKQESALKALGTEGLFLFSSLDTDRDMYISPEEFKPIAEKLTGTRRGWGPERGAPQAWPLASQPLCLP